MSEVITCSVKQARKLMEHLNEDDMVTFTMINRKTNVVTKPIRIKKKNSEELIDKADNIEYQNNDFFGRLSFFGTVKDKDIVKNILFPQLE